VTQLPRKKLATSLHDTLLSLATAARAALP